MIVASLALASAPTSASATYVSVTYTGTVTSDSDLTGIFGTVNGTNNLVGKTYTSNFLFDIPRGVPQNTPPPNASQGYSGDDAHFTVPPAISATVTIGVTTVDLGHIDSAQIIAHQSPASSDQMHSAADTFQFPFSFGTTSSQSFVSGPAGSVPFTLTGPFTYIPSASGGSGSQSFLENACLITLVCAVNTGVQANVLSLTVGQAQYTWGGTGSSTTTNDYNLGSNWSNPPAAAPPVAAGQSAIFANTGSATVMVTAGPIAPDSWTFNANAQSYTISGVSADFSLAGPTGGIINNANAGQTITISNIIHESVAGVMLQQLGNSTLVLTANDTYTGPTIVTAGTLVIAATGSITSNVTNNATFNNAGTVTGTVSNAGTFTNSAGATVSGLLTNTAGTTNNAGALNGGANITGGTLTGAGSVGNLTIGGGALFAPGNGTPGTSMTVAGNLAFQSGAIYLIQLNPATSSFANVTGTATLGGATVDAFWANGSYVSKKYTILTATGGVNGSFGPLVNTNLPANFSTSLSQDANNAFLNLTLSFAPPPGPIGGLNGNRQNVANALINFFNSTGGIPMVYATLSPGGLSQAAGETATGSQQTTFDAMTQFMGLLTDPFMNRSGNGAGTGATPFAEEADAANAYSASRSKSERDAYAAIYRTRLPLAAPCVPSWSVWAAGFGGSQTTDGKCAAGAPNNHHQQHRRHRCRSRLSGLAEYAGRLCARRRRHQFQPQCQRLRQRSLHRPVPGRRLRPPCARTGLHLQRHWPMAGRTSSPPTAPSPSPASISFAPSSMPTSLLGPRSRGRLSLRHLRGWAASESRPMPPRSSRLFDLCREAYAEQAIAGSNAFALAYGARDVTDSRSELGIRTDKSFAMTNSILTLRGRLAWAHDFNPDRSIGATFQALPGASFVVNGAAQASDSALTTASAELKWTNGWSAAATFEGEFSAVTSSYAGKGVVRYAW